MTSPPAEQRFSFDEVAELYDRARPRYPAEVVEDIETLSGIGADGRILEIGCGTGQLSVSLAARGFRMLCLEPGPSMARVARQRLASESRVEVVSQTFEAWPLEAGAFDLVVSAQAFHWVDPAIRFAKAAKALRRGGSLAVLGNSVTRDESPVRTAIDRAYAAHTPSLSSGAAAAGWYAEEALLRGLFHESGVFGPVAVRHLPWSRVHSADDYLDLMRTHSDHRMLPEAQLESLLAAIRRAIADHGGSFEVRYEAHLYLARAA